MVKISVVINVVDEEVKDISRAIASIEDFADDIVIVDMTSLGFPGTKSVKQKDKIRVYKHERVPYVELIRNFGILKAKGEWVLILDPDEEISSGLSSDLRKIVNNPEADYYRVPRKNIIFGKWIKHSRWWPDYNIRFFKKENVSWSEIIHSVPMTKGRGLDLEAEEDNAIIHHHYESVEQFIERLNRYTTEHAKLLLKGGYRFDWSDLIQKPAGEYLSRYFEGEGYKDGLHGFALAGLQAFSEFVMYLKVWQLEKFKEGHADIEEVVNEMKEAESEIHYWESDALLREVGGLKHRIKRKFRLP